MGFSVTAAVVIFGVALLGAFSVASSAYWKNAATLDAAQRAMQDRTVNEAHANLSMSAVTWDGVGATETFTLTNTGTTVLDFTRFHYMIDGVLTFAAQSPGYPKLNGASAPASKLLLAGDIFDCRFGLASQPSRLTVVTEYGNVYARNP